MHARVAALVAGRLLWLAPTLLGLVALTFAIARVIPADPAALAAGEAASAAQVEIVRQRLGLDQPIAQQFLQYLGNVVTGELGTSLFTQRDISEDLWRRLPATLELSLAAMLFAVLVGVPLGVVAGRYSNTILDHVVRFVTVAGFAVAGFWLALMLQLLFSMKLGVLPLSGRVDGFPPSGATGLLTVDALLAGRPDKFVEAMRHLALPALALGLPVMATLVRFARSGIIEVRASPQLAYQRAMGVPGRVSLWRYALRHALVAVVTQIGLAFGIMLSGSVVIETIFNWPGVGNYAFNSILQSDYPAIMGFTLWAGVSFVVVNLFVDALVVAIDPREGER